jgi:hypothetical protein
VLVTSCPMRIWTGIGAAVVPGRRIPTGCQRHTDGPASLGAAMERSARLTLSGSVRDVFLHVLKSASAQTSNELVRLCPECRHLFQPWGSGDTVRGCAGNRASIRWWRGERRGESARVDRSPYPSPREPLVCSGKIRI